MATIGSALSGDGVDTFLTLTEQASAPATPATGERVLYAKADGLYEKDDAGTETGPLGVGGGGGGGGGREVLGTTYYNPGTATSTAATTSLADIDATNLAVTFTAPTSGIVWVRLSALAYCAANASTQLAWGLREGTTTIVEFRAASFMQNTEQNRPYWVAKVTGLTASTSYTWKWAQKGSSVDCGTYYGDFAGPAVMEVLAG